MPCVCDDFPDVDRVADLKNEVDSLTQMLCWLCGEYDIDFSKNNRLSRWWDAHLKADRDRVHYEMSEYVEDHGVTNKDELAEVFISEAEKVHAVSDWHKDWFYNLAGEVISEYCDTLESDIGKKKKLLARLSSEERKLLGFC